LHVQCLGIPQERKQALVELSSSTAHRCT